MAKDKSTARFWFRSDRPNSDGTCPVHLVYQIKGQRNCYAIPGVKLFPHNWDPNSQRAVYLDKKNLKKVSPEFDAEAMIEADGIQDTNVRLENTLKSVRDIEERFRLDGKPYSPGKVIATLKENEKPKAIKDEPQVNIRDFITKFCEDNTELQPGTLKEYKSLAIHIDEFQRYKKVKLTFLGDAVHLKSFSHFLTEYRRVNNITKAKLISTFKTVLRYAKRIPYKYTVNPEYLEYREKSLTRKDSDYEVIALTEEELQAIIDLDLSNNKALDEARDILVFSCSTSLRYSDLHQLRRSHISKDGLIKLTTIKGKKKAGIPLNPISSSILKKYADKPFPLPVTKSTQRIVSNQKLNKRLKDVAKLAEINTEIEKVRQFGSVSESKHFPKHKLISIHTGRKTFVTLSLERGMPLQEVMSMSGHVSFKAAKRYIDVAENRKKESMAKAWGKIPNPLKVAK